MGNTIFHLLLIYFENDFVLMLTFPPILFMYIVITRFDIKIKIDVPRKGVDYTQLLISRKPHIKFSKATQNFSFVSVFT